MQVRVNSNMQGPGILDGDRGRYVFMDTSFTAELEDGLRVTGRLSADPAAGTLGFERVAITSEGPLTPARLRGIRWAEVLNTVLDQVTVAAEVHEGGFTLLPLAEPPGGASIRNKPRRRTLNDDHYREVAERYREALEDHRPPVVAVADEMHASRNTAKGWVQEARKRGLLGDAPAPGAKGETR